MGKIGKDTLAMALVLVAAVVVLIASQVFGSHKQPEIQSSVKVEQGIYDSEAILFAQTEVQNEIDKGTFLNSDSPGLEFLAYLAEGALCFPEKVDSARVRMLANAAQGPLDSITDPTDKQQNLLTRIKTANDATSPQSVIATGGITAASVSPDGTSKISPVETICR